MAEMVIRQIPDEVHQALKLKAAADGKGLEPWMREQMMMLAAMPTIKQSSTSKCFGEDGAHAMIKRHHSGLTQRGCSNGTQLQFDAPDRAAMLCERNGLGDRERAISLLLTQFAEVFES